MEPVAKKTKLTDHFRVALRPRDLNVANINNNNNNCSVSNNNSSSNNNNATSNNNNLKRHINHNIIQKLPLQETTSQQQQQQHRPGPLKATTSSIRENKSQLAQRLGALLQHQHYNHQHQHHPQQQQQQQQFKKALDSPRKRVEVITIIDDDDDEQTEIDDEAEQDRTAASSKSTADNNNTSANSSECIHDFETTVLDNVFWEPHYACDSFEYDKKQELKFTVNRNELDISSQLRAELVDWLVAIQVRYSLDHEPLYMAVKLADHYLMRKCVPEEDTILIYLTTMFIAAKFDERQSCITIPLMIRQARAKFGVKYTRKQIINLEVDLLTTLNFDLRFPLSYGFLRRFARCTRSDMKTINLARYILESSLMDFDMIEILESEIAAGSLLLAHEMLHHTGAWDATARHYTGYEEKQLFPLIIRLNRMLLKLTRKKTAIKRKYSHELFMEVAKIPPILPELLRLLASSCTR